jgi:hypothetical protein
VSKFKTPACFLKKQASVLGKGGELLGKAGGENWERSRKH